MNFDDLATILTDRMSESIKTENVLLRTKIMLNFDKWLRTNYKKDLIRCCELGDKFTIVSIVKKIEKIYMLSDYEKIKVLYIDNEFELFKKLSQEVFNLTTNFYEKEEPTSIDIDFDEYQQKLESFKSKISEVYISDYERELSECLLDLEYLKNKGNVTAYSIRLHNYID